MKPRVSVIVPVHNRAHSVLPTLQSVQAQTVREWECIVVDDGSSDGEQLQAVVDGLADPRFRTVRRPNGGGGAARNTGIDEARGEIVAFLDSDDRWLPEKLAADLAAGAGEKIVFSPMLVERGGRIVGTKPRTFRRAQEPVGDWLARRQGFVPTSTLSLPVELARQVRYSDKLPFGQDTDFAIRLAATQTDMVMLPAPTAIMRDDEDPQRVSRSSRWEAVLAWTEDVRPLISRRAFLALRGWHGARLAAQSGEHGKAFALYANALANGALPPRLALKALAQILVHRSLYTRFAARVRG